MENNSVYEYFAKAQSEFLKIEKNKTVKVRTKSGGEYTFDYADLDEILSKTKPALNRNGFAVSWTTTKDFMTCSLLHKLGTISSTTPMPTLPQSPQEIGGLLTYFRRYTLCSLLGVVADDDTDASEQQGDFKIDGRKNINGHHYQIGFGKKYYGQELHQVPIDELKSFYEWTIKQERKTSEALEFIKQCDLYFTKE